jgi:CheY-like chemotaxis protein
MMGGDLELQSELGQGSRFYFTLTLPFVRTAPRPAHAPCRALVVDDNPHARAVLERMCQSLGWQVDLADSGESARQWIAQRHAQGLDYQTILLDWAMQGMDGWAGEVHDALVLAMVTAHESEMLSERSPAELALLGSFLIKPITASMLSDAVAEARSGHALHPLDVSAQPAQTRLDGMRLLLVEDNLNNQQVARELLEAEGAVVRIANNGQEAVETVAATVPPFDVVLMDLQMPVMDGFTATRVIRNELKLANLPIVAMTANAMASDREACLAACMNDHIGKPFDLNHLVQVLRSQARWIEALSTPVIVKPSFNTEVEHAATFAAVDLTTALQRLGNKQDVYRRLLKTFINDLQDMSQQLTALAQAHTVGSSPNDAKRILHTLKGLAATLGANGLSSEAAAAEKAMALSLTAEQVLATSHQACGAMAAALPGLRALLAALHKDDAAANTNSAAPTAQALDKPALAASLHSMIQFLQANDMESMTAMAELQKQFGASLGEEMAPLEGAMASLDFAGAIPLCTALQVKFAS